MSRSILSFSVATILAAGSAGTTHAAETEALPPGIASFKGSIEERTVADFIARHRDETIRRVIVDSPGGDVVSALKLANWMVDRQVDVEVADVCASSCANYLFAAGRTKIIDDGAIVIWHGSLLQKNFRDHCAPKAPRSDPEYGPPGYLAALTVRTREDEAAYCASYHAAVAVQDAFFARVHVDEYVTRMGQEPTNFGKVWTMPVAAMERMGLTQVVARPGYASADDMKHFNTDPDDTVSVISLDLDPAGNVVDVTR